MKAEKLPVKYDRLDYERGVTDGGRSYRSPNKRKARGSMSYLAGYDRGMAIELQKDTRADEIAAMKKT